jgi:hypothetical protein
MGKIQVEIALCDAPKPSPPGLEDGPLAFGRVAMSTFLADVFFAVFDAPVPVDPAQKLIASPRVRVHLASLLHVRKRRGKEALLACTSAEFEDAPSAASLHPRDHQRAVPSAGAPSALR